MLDVNIIKDLNFFYEFHEKELKEIAKACDYKIYQPGEVIMAEGEPGGTLYIIKRGEVKITKKLHNQEDVVLTILRENDFLGELSLLDGRNRSATAAAVTKAELVILEKNKFDALAKQSPACGYKVIKKIAIAIGSLLREMNEKFIGMVDYMWR